MSHAGPSECPPTVRGRRPSEWQSQPGFSFVCSLKILVPPMDLPNKAIAFHRLLPMTGRAGAKPGPGTGTHSPRRAAR